MNVTSDLHAVTIYREGAVCTRRAKVRSVSTEVRVVGLPMGLVPGSVRGRILTGPLGLRVLDVRPGFEVQFGEAIDESAEIKARDAAKVEVARLEVSFNRFDAELRELQTLKPLPFTPKAGDAPRAAPVEATQTLTDFIDTRLERLLIEKRAIERQLKDAREELHLRERRLSEASSEKRSERAKVTRAIVFSFSIESAEPVELEVEYQVPGVRWVPNYTLRLEKGFLGGTLRMRASVAQDTGEDWKGVALSLSTARLERRTDVPELKSLRIGRTQPQPQKPAFRALPPGLDELFEGYDQARGRSALAHATLLSAPQPRPQQHVKRSSGLHDELEDEETEVEREETFHDDDEPDEAERTPTNMRREAPARSMPARSMSVATARGGRAFFDTEKMTTDSGAPSVGGVGTLMVDADDAGDVYEAMDVLSQESPTGSGTAFLIPAFTPAESLLDYDRLRMPGVEVASARGKLSRASEFESVFAVGVSVQVDVVLAALATWQQRLTTLSHLALPARCVRVESFDHFDFRYDCVAPVEVPSTGTWTTVPVMECQVGLRAQYVCVPSLEPHVYRTLSISNSTTAALLSGPVEVSVGDEFLMTTTMPAIPPGANTERLGLGVEEAIKVARKTHFTETTGGFLGGSQLLKHELHIEVNNRLSTAADLEVRERVPVPNPSEKEIKVEEGEVKPPWERVEGVVDGVVVNGMRRWRLTLPPGGRTSLTAQVQLRIPADKMLVGGNRRG
jgi:hypothetical protein